MNDDVGVIIFCVGAAVFALGGGYILLRRKPRRYQDVYRFNLVEWKSEQDSYTLYDIESFFREGQLQETAKYKDRSLQDFHSTLKFDDKEHFTGFTRFSIMIWHEPGFFDKHGYLEEKDPWPQRYFYATLAKPATAFLEADSKLLGPNLPDHFAFLQDELKILEQNYGFANWFVTVHEHDLVILVPELLKAKEVHEFLGLCEKIVARFEK